MTIHRPNTNVIYDDNPTRTSIVIEEKRGGRKITLETYRYNNPENPIDIHMHVDNQFGDTEEIVTIQLTPEAVLKLAKTLLTRLTEPDDKKPTP